MKVADAMAAILKKEGVEYLFTYPTTPLIDACARIGIRPVLCRQERVGAHMADAYSRMHDGGKIGVFAMQYGPGAENAFAGVATAYSDSSPVLFIPLGHPRERAQVFPLFSSAKSFDAIVKSVETLNMPDEVGAVMRRAFTALKMGRLGPAMIELPVDVAKCEIDDAIVDAYAPTRVARTAASEDDVDAAAQALLSAKRPVIVAGQGVLYARATTELVALAELAGIPVMTTLEGKSAFPEDHALSLGTGGIVMTGPVRHFLERADLVLGVGTSFTRHNMATNIPGKKTFVQITNDARDLNKSYQTDYPVLGDARLALRQFAAALRDLGARDTRRPDVEAEIRQVHAAWIAEWMPRLTSNETPITPYRVVWDFMRSVDPATTVVTHDSGSPRDQILPFYRATNPRGFLGWGKSHALGSGIGMIMGAKMAAPDKFCVGFQGDAAFGMSGLDFETAVRCDIPITTIVWNNNSMATEVHALPVAHERYRVRDIGGTYAEMGLAMGGRAERIDRPGEIVPAIERARRANLDGHAYLLEIVTSHEVAFSHRHAF